MVEYRKGVVKSLWIIDTEDSSIERRARHPTSAAPSLLPGSDQLRVRRDFPL